MFGLALIGRYLSSTPYHALLHGRACTAGVVSFVLDERVRYAHVAWHLFVLTGSVRRFVPVSHDTG